MPSQWKRLFVNANDGSNEGIQHVTKPIFSVQFHPEAKGGPQDTYYLFEEFLNYVRAEKASNDVNKSTISNIQQSAIPTCV
jgi:carbamoyl-phosphate synthase small subunit